LSRLRVERVLGGINPSRERDLREKYQRYGATRGGKGGDSLEEKRDLFGEGCEKRPCFEIRIRNLE